ncbi:General transcription factor 2-related zinc finger protein [Abeliophyllum distichum]|uniref:General transcription factor 2-related zinc finger protein n=1 Tax=Abeliophyllum distichum TaxID=126358 RepID=A0ABD1SZN1_9LAMI
MQNYRELVAWFGCMLVAVAWLGCMARSTMARIIHPPLRILVRKDKVRICLCKAPLIFPVDEAHDNSMKEQMVVVLRYVDKSGYVKEHFLAISHVIDTSAQPLKDANDEIFSRHSLSISKLRGTEVLADLFNMMSIIVNLVGTYVSVLMLSEQATTPKFLQSSIRKNFAVVVELNDRFSETRTELLTCISSLNPKNSFACFDTTKLVRLSQLYPIDFTNEDIMLLIPQLDNFLMLVRSDAAFADLNSISCITKRLVQTGYHCYFPLVYRLITLVLTLCGNCEC